LTVVGLIAGNVAAIYAALYLVAPNLKPREKLGASISTISIQNDVPVREYERQMGTSEDDRDRDPERLGSMIFVSASIVGFTDRSYSMAVVPLDSVTRTAATPPTQPMEFTSTCESQTIKATEDVASWRCWIDNRGIPSTFIIRAELYDGGPTEEIRAGVIEGYRPLLHFLDSPVVTR
jgi:hypothetical protein